MTRHKGKTVTVATFRSDPLFPRIERAVATILKTKKVVTPIDVLVGMHLLTHDKVEDWRRGRVAYLERVINCNLTRLSRLLRILRFHAHDLNLVPSTTDYRRHGKGPKHSLRFTKTGEPRLEVAYSTHFVWPGKSPFHPPRVVGAIAPTDEIAEIEHTRRNSTESSRHLRSLPSPSVIR
jgi:hypothetical protein